MEKLTIGLQRGYIIIPTKSSGTCRPLEIVCPSSMEDVIATIVYGGVYDVHQHSEYKFLRDDLDWIERCLHRDTPILGWVWLSSYPADPAGSSLFRKPIMFLETHWEGWFKLPAGAIHLASNEHFPHQSFCYGDTAYAFQFHPEAHFKMLERWVSPRSAERAPERIQWSNS